MSQNLQPADPDEVDREGTMAIGDCPNCGPHTLATVKVEDATYITSCAQCDYEQRAPVLVDGDGETKVDAENAEETGLEDE